MNTTPSNLFWVKCVLLDFGEKKAILITTREECASHNFSVTQYGCLYGSIGNATLGPLTHENELKLNHLVSFFISL